MTNQEADRHLSAIDNAMGNLPPPTKPGERQALEAMVNAPKALLRDAKAATRGAYGSIR